jgi:diphosphomevalonate decarboxylase
MSNPRQATAISHPNIAFIKYWGNKNNDLRIPENGSVSMNLNGLETRTTVTFSETLAQDELELNGDIVHGAARDRVSHFLDKIRTLGGLELAAHVKSTNNFPTGAGIASSAAAFSALALAGSTAAGLALSEKDLSRLARFGSGSASRSIPGGFVEWQAGNTDEDSYALSILPADHWAIVDCIAIIKSIHKPVGSTAGHSIASTSIFQKERVSNAQNRLDICRKALVDRDFLTFAEIVEYDSNLMHAVMMTSHPRLFYWEPASLQLMKIIPEWRQTGLPVCYTLDAGPNVHVLTTQGNVKEVVHRLENIEGVKKILTASAGGPARLLN